MNVRAAAACAGAACEPQHTVGVTGERESVTSVSRAEQASMIVQTAGTALARDETMSMSMSKQTAGTAGQWARSEHVWREQEAGEGPRPSSHPGTGGAGGQSVLQGQQPSDPAVVGSSRGQAADPAALLCTLHALGPAVYMAAETSSETDARDDETDDDETETCAVSAFEFPKLTADTARDESEGSDISVKWWGVDRSQLEESTWVPSEPPTTRLLATLRSQAAVDDRQWVRLADTWQQHAPMGAVPSVSLKLVAQDSGSVSAVVVPVVPSLKFKGSFNGIRCTILIDCGAEGNVISRSFVQKHNITTAPATHSDGKPVTVKLADGHVPSRVFAGTRGKFKIGTYKDEGTFLVTDLDGQDVILGMPWLHDRNPLVDWRAAALTGAVTPAGHQGLCGGE